jgi:hypothetical protein
MSEIKIHTNASDSPFVATRGTTVTVDGVEIRNIGGVELIGRPGECWELVIRVAVDPAKLFVPDAPAYRFTTRKGEQDLRDSPESAT